MRPMSDASVANVDQSAKRAVTRSSYTERERLVGLAVYAETGSSRAVERETGIPASTIESWLDQDECLAMVEQLRTAIRSRAAWQCIERIELSHQYLMERITKGDPVVMRNGSVRYVPVKARDLMLINACSTDKALLLANAIEGSKHQDSALNALADKLAASVANKLKESTTKPKEPEGEGSATGIPIEGFLG